MKEEVHPEDPNPKAKPRKDPMEQLERNFGKLEVGKKSDTPTASINQFLKKLALQQKKSHNKNKKLKSSGRAPGVMWKSPKKIVKKTKKAAGG